MLGGALEVVVGVLEGGDGAMSVEAHCDDGVYVGRGDWGWSLWAVSDGEGGADGARRSSLRALGCCEEWKEVAGAWDGNEIG